jgi:hypothetical protein
MNFPYSDPRIDKLIDTLPLWQKKECTKIRQLIHEAEPEIEETIKHRDRPYFVLQGNICALQATKDQLNESAFKNLIKSVASNNRVGGWRKLKQP